MTEVGGGAVKLSEADRLLLTLWSAKMSTASIAMMLGGRWTEARVYNRLAVLREPEAVGASPAVAPAVAAGSVAVAPGDIPQPAAAPVIDRSPRPGLKPAVIAAAVAPIRAPVPAQVLPPLVNPPFIKRQKDYSGAEDDIIRAAWRDHPGHAGSAAHAQLDGRTIGSIRYRAFMLGLRQDGGSRQDGAQPTPRSRAAKGRGLARQPVHTAQRIKPLTPRVLRFAGWFHVADWPLDEIADLFDLDVEGLGLALGVKAGVAA